LLLLLCGSECFVVAALRFRVREFVVLCLVITVVLDFLFYTRKGPSARLPSALSGVSLRCGMKLGHARELTLFFFFFEGSSFCLCYRRYRSKTFDPWQTLQQALRLERHVSQTTELSVEERVRHEPFQTS